VIAGGFQRLTADEQSVIEFSGTIFVKGFAPRSPAIEQDETRYYAKITTLQAKR